MQHLKDRLIGSAAVLCHPSGLHKEERDSALEPVALEELSEPDRPLLGQPAQRVRRRRREHVLGQGFGFAGGLAATACRGRHQPHGHVGVVIRRPPVEDAGARPVDHPAKLGKDVRRSVRGGVQPEGGRHLGQPELAAERRQPQEALGVKLELRLIGPFERLLEPCHHPLDPRVVYGSPPQITTLVGNRVICIDGGGRRRGRRPRRSVHIPLAVRPHNLRYFQLVNSCCGGQNHLEVHLKAARLEGTATAASKCPQA
mmetsp:Transcript_36339/g.95214  ORF Transcript_36339/g.95214 Transcript_36339/m.95214 type:complete len:257 (+) Transcript_36339:915-1685(+)